MLNLFFPLYLQGTITMRGNCIKINKRVGSRIDLDIHNRSVPSTGHLFLEIVDVIIKKKHKKIRRQKFHFFLVPTVFRINTNFSCTVKFWGFHVNKLGKFTFLNIRKDLFSLNVLNQIILGTKYYPGNSNLLNKQIVASIATLLPKRMEYIIEGNLLEKV